MLLVKEGRIIKLIGGLYTVIDEDRNRHVLKPLGIFRHKYPTESWRFSQFY